MATTERGAADELTDEALVEAFLTAFVGGDTARVAELVTDDCVLHQPRWPLDREGRDAIVEAAGNNEGMLADLEMTVEELVVGEDRIAAYVTARGRNVGPGRMGKREIAPTGRSFEVPNFGIYRVEDGRVAEAWVLTDLMSFARQVGNLPTGPGKMLAIAWRQLRWRLGGRKRLD